MADAEPRVHRSIAPYAAAAGLVALAAFLFCTSLAVAEVRRAALFGVVASSIASAAALAALGVGIKKGTNGLLAGIGLGFLARLIAVAVGLIASGAQGRTALLYAASFFAIYASTQAVEIAYVWASSRGRAAKV